MSMIRVHSNLRDYEVSFDTIKANLDAIQDNYDNRIYVVDANVWEIYKDKQLKVLEDRSPIIIPIKEEYKNLEMVQELYDKLIVHSVKRNMTLVSIGGGILQDITGFVASTLYRGVSWVFMPTTLLAQSDSCIGSKTSLNYKNYKNLIGTFYPPVHVYISADFVATLHKIDFYSGIGEIVKLHLMGGRTISDKCTKVLKKVLEKDNEMLQEAIYTSLKIKQSYIEGDEFDKGRRNLLNYGHCFGHAIESVSSFDIPHGQAVVLGMMLANIVACKRNTLSQSMEKEIYDLMLLPILFKQPESSHLNPDAIIEGMKKDKKRTGDKLPLVMLRNDCDLERVNDLTGEEARNALCELQNKLNIEYTSRSDS